MKDFYISAKGVRQPVGSQYDDPKTGALVTWRGQDVGIYYSDRYATPSLTWWLKGLIVLEVHGRSYSLIDHPNWWDKILERGRPTIFSTDSSEKMSEYIGMVHDRLWKQISDDIKADRERSIDPSMWMQEWPAPPPDLYKEPVPIYRQDGSLKYVDMRPRLKSSRVSRDDDFSEKGYSSCRTGRR